MVAKVSALCINGGGELVFKIWSKEKEVGTLHLITTFTPQQLLVSAFDTDELEQVTKDEEMANNYLRSDIEAMKAQLRQIQEKKNFYLQETQKSIEFHESGNKQIERYKKVYKEFGPKSKGKPKEIEKRTLMPIILDFDSTIVEVSEYIKGGDASD